MSTVSFKKMYRFYKIMFFCFKIKVMPQVFLYLFYGKAILRLRSPFFDPDAVGIIVTCFKTMFVCFKIKYQNGFVTIRRNWTQTAQQPMQPSSFECVPQCDISEFVARDPLRNTHQVPHLKSRRNGRLKKSPPLQQSGRKPPSRTSLQLPPKERGRGSTSRSPSDSGKSWSKSGRKTA